MWTVAPPAACVWTSDGTSALGAMLRGRPAGPGAPIGGAALRVRKHAHTRLLVGATRHACTHRACTYGRGRRPAQNLNNN
jgi:hypothetical protein